MKQKVYLNEESLQRLVENCVYDMLNEDMDENFLTQGLAGIGGVAKNGFNAARKGLQNFGKKVATGAKKFGNNVSNAYNNAANSQARKEAVTKCQKYYQYYIEMDNLMQKFGISPQEITGEGGQTTMNLQ